MAQQDKTDWYWNGMLAGAVNNLYYDLINVDVCHVPYATNHRNSSFFLKTRLPYWVSDSWLNWTDTNWREVTDIKIIRDDTCEKEKWNVYVLWKKWTKKAIFGASLTNWCVWTFFNCSENCQSWSSDFYDLCPDMQWEEWCGDWKLFSTNYVKWMRRDWDDLIKATWDEPLVYPWVYTWIQMNKYNLWTTIWLFSDEYVESRQWEFKWKITQPWNYLLVYASWDDDESGFAWQVRMITGTENSWWVTRITVDSPRLGFKVLDSSNFQEWEEKIQKWYRVSYAVFEDWWEIIWFTDSNKIYLLPNQGECSAINIYKQKGNVDTNIIWVADANDKIFILTDNWYIHYSKEGIWYNKFFIDDDMFAWVDKSSITAYRDMVLAFWKKHIAIWVPDEQNRFWTMYNQSTSIWLWSRYSYAEYEWDLIFVSNDKRLLALTVNSTWRYWLTFDDVWDRLNSKLSALIPWDEVFVWSDNNNLRVFVNTKPIPYIKDPSHFRADINTSDWNTMTHIYKFDTLFKVWTEDHIKWNLIKWASEGIYYWDKGIYIRQDWSYDYWNNDFDTIINAYIIENESDWIWWTGSWLANRPKLYNLAKLNRLITTLWPWIYSSNSKIKITTYSKWIWYTYEFPVNWDSNDWVWLITSYYLNEWLSEEEREKIECMLSTLQDSQKQYQPNCPNSNVMRQYIRQDRPRCDSYTEMITESHWVCINDKIYELAPTMPLTTNLWENQPYATQIKLELIWWKGDIICFGWWLAEMFIVPLFTTWPDWEYQLQPMSDC